LKLQAFFLIGHTKDIHEAKQVPLGPPLLQNPYQTNQCQ
jgi:hypothetical protein